MEVKQWIKRFISYRKSILFLSAPIVFLFVPILVDGKAGRCAYAIAIMVVYWMTETLPMSATALLPIALFPWLGVQGAREVCPNYFKGTNVLFFGGLLFAVSVERWNLHKRIALKVLMLVGSKPHWLMFGFMATTAFLSMWLSNTATTAMLVPIAHEVTQQMLRHYRNSNSNNAPVAVYDNPTLTDDADCNVDIDKAEDGLCTIHSNTDQRPVFHSKQKDTALEEPQNITTKDDNDAVEDYSCDEAASRRLALGMKLCICWAANIGGTATLTGTGPNLVVINIIEQFYGSDTGLNYGSWFIFAFPNMLMCLLISWLWLLLSFIGPSLLKTSAKNQGIARPKKIIRKEYKKLGSTTFAEISVACLFSLLVLIWISKKPAFMPGWESLPFINKGYVTDASVGMSLACLMFILPSQKPSLFSAKQAGPVPALLDWSTTHSKFNWGIIVLIGGSFAVADACQKSGLSDSIGEMFVNIGNMPTWCLVLLFSFLAATITELGSNVATTTIMLPIVVKLSENFGIHPFYLVITVTISCSFSFMLPVATAPNAIVYSYKDVQITDMVKNGLVLNVVCLLVLQISIHTYGRWVFNLENYPNWAKTSFNTTALTTV